MAIEMNDRNRPVRLVDTPQQRQRDGMVPAHGYNPRQGLASAGETDLVCVGEGLAHEEAVVACFDLLDGPVVVEPNQYISLSCSMVEMRWGETHEVTGTSPQSKTLKSSPNGFASRGTLYPPLLISQIQQNRRHTRDSASANPA